MAIGGEDIWAYMDFYENASRGSDTGHELFFELLMQGCARIGLPFYVFRCITAFVTFIGLEYATFKLTKNVNIVWALYIIYSSMFDAELIRASMAMGIIAVFFVHLIRSNKRIQSYLFCAFVILIATLFHSSSVMFLLFIPAWHFINNKITQRQIILVILTTLIMGAGVGVMFRFVGSLLSEKNMDYYESMYHGSILFNIANYILYIIPIIFLPPRKTRLSGVPISLIESNIFKINLLFLFVLVPQFYVSLFSRLFKLLIFLNYVYLASRAENSKLKPIVALFGLIYAFSLLFIRIFFYPHLIPMVLDMQMDSNVIFDLLRF